jgi:hypothetical protein
MSFCSSLRDVEKEERTHFEIKDGVRVWVKGKKKNKYEGLDSSKMDLQSRIDSGVFENHEGTVRNLEKVEGSDYLQKVLNELKVKHDESKSRVEKLKLRKKYEEEYEKFLKNNSNNN